MDFGTDWQNPTSYENTKSHTLKMWAWEFIRRNPKYWSYWKESVRLWSEEVHYLKKEQERRKDLLSTKMGYSTFDKIQILVADSAKQNGGGLASLIQHNRSDFYHEENHIPPDDKRFVLTRQSAEKEWGFLNLYPPENKAPASFTFDGTRVYEKDKDPLYLPSNNVAVRFNLKKDINKQIQLAKSKLLQLQKQKELKPLNPKIRSREWQVYLRLLDADNARVPRKESAPIIFPRLSDVAAKSSYTNGLKRAKEIMHKDYRNWL